MKIRDVEAESVLIQDNAIGAEDLKWLSAFAQQAQMSDSLVSNFEEGADESTVEWVINKNVRNTQDLLLTDAAKENIDRVINSGVVKFINPFYRAEVSATEPPQILHYGVGGHYIPHVDAETLYKDERGLDAWEKTLERDLSIVYFLNDNFSGGELVFPKFELVVKPQAGTLICFPSDHNYIHGVNPVTAGHRYTLVSWMRVKDMPAMKEINRMTMDAFNRAWPEQMQQPPRLRKGGMSAK